MIICNYPMIGMRVSEIGNDFDICMNKILNYDNARFRDWTLWTENKNKLDQILSKGF